MDEQTSQTIIEERKVNALNWMKTHMNWIYYGLLAVVIWFSAIFIRTANMPGLKDVTTGKWTLAPDLDPFLFLRWAKDIVANNGVLPIIDKLRYVPFEYHTSSELPVVSYAIAYFYKFLHLFNSTVTIEYAAVLMPVIFFVLMMIAFFMFVRQLFINNEHKNLIALISTAFLSVIPGFLHRTLAGVPEKEGIAFLFLFLTFYFLLKAWQKDGMLRACIFGTLAGISTGLMGLAWGGVEFAFISVSLTAFIAFFVCDFKNKDKIAYTMWVIGFTAILFWFPRFGTTLFTKAVSAMSYAVLAGFIFHSTGVSQWVGDKFKIKLPSKLISFILLVTLGVIALLILQPSMITAILAELRAALITPFEGNRFTVTVAENARIYLDTFMNSFGYLFWVFLGGAVLYFYEQVKHLDKKKCFNLTAAFTLLTAGIILTRISPVSLLNGENTISLILYIGSAIIALSIFLYEYCKDSNWNIDIASVMLLSTLFFALLSSRTAVRMMYFLFPIIPIYASFAIVQLSEIAWKTKEETAKLLFAVFAISSIILSGFTLYSYSISSYNEARGSVIVGNPYFTQWWSAMDWVRDNTPADAVFSHWWDYGHQIAAMGERATVLDGGNYFTYWDYLMGHEVLTAENESQALVFMKTHKSEYLLIDSSDVGKYPAFASIGSDVECNQYAWIPTFLGSNSQIIEKRNETQYILQGGTNLDEDVKYGGQTYIKEMSGIVAIVVSVTQQNESFKFNQPTAIFVTGGAQKEVPFNCVFYQGKKTLFQGGIDSCIYLMPQVTSTGVLPIGGGLWLSPRLMRSQFTRLYLLNETEKFTLVHSEPNVIITQLNQQYGFNLPELTLYGGELMGPIKIWKADTSEVTENPKWLETEYPDQRLFTGMCT